MNAGVEKNHQELSDPKFEEWTCRWSIVEMEMGLLDAFTMISLGIGEPEQSFFEKVAAFRSAAGPSDLSIVLEGVLLFLIPKRKSHILKTMCVRYSGDSILAPTECSGSRMIVREV